MTKFSLYIPAAFLIITGLVNINCGNKSETASSINKAQSQNIDNNSVMKDSITKIAIDKKYLLGQFTPEKDSNFVQAETKYAGTGIWLRKPVWAAFKKMADAASKDGIQLFIVSGTRTFSRQKTIWEQKWDGQRLVNGKNLSLTVKDPKEKARQILTYSAMPGTSRHHWGTDIDLNSMNPEYFKTGKGKKIFDWLEANAATYGFCRPYTAKGPERPYGHEEEYWHWSYLPISSQYLKEYSEKITYLDISGFKGSETAGDLDVIEHYIKGINNNCLPM